MNNLAHVNCGICGASESEPIHQIRGFQIVRCVRCGCIYTNPRHVWDYSRSGITLPGKLSMYQQYYWPKRKASADRFWKGAENFRQTGSLLEVGCGFGFFLNEARLHGWSVTGVEIAQDEAAWGRDHFELSIVSVLDDMQLHEQQFDVVVLWDVIEHIPDVIPVLKRCYKLIRPGGVLVLKTPNADGLRMQPAWWSWVYLQFYWQLIYPANPLEHVYHFTPSLLSKTLQEHNFNVLKIDTEQSWQERIVVGRNLLVKLTRFLLMWIAWRLHLPYEMIVWAEKPL